MSDPYRESAPPSSEPKTGHVVREIDCALDPWASEHPSALLDDTERERLTHKVMLGLFTLMIVFGALLTTRSRTSKAGDTPAAQPDISPSGWHRAVNAK